MEPDQKRRSVSGYNGKEPDVAYWIEQIHLGIRWRKETAFEARWPTWRKMYRGEWKDNVLANNLFFRMVRSVVPKIYFRNPGVSILTGRAGAENYVLSNIMERVDNTLIRRMGLKDEMKRMAQLGWMYGTGVGKAGFGSKYAGTPDPNADNRAPTKRKGRERLEYDRLIIPNMPYVKAVHPGAFILPYGTVRVEDARWKAFHFTRPVEDVKADPRFKNTRDLGGTAFNSLPEAIGKQQTRLEGNVQNEVDLFEIRDSKTGQVFVISAGSDKPHLVEEDFYSALDVDPAYTLTFNIDDETAWGLADSQILDPLQREVNDIHTTAMYHRRMSTLKILARRGNVDSDELEKLYNGEVSAALFVDGDLDDSLKPFQPAYVPPDLYQGADMLESMIRDTMGFSRNQAGEFKQGSRSLTATEVNAVQESSELRLDERRDMMADLLVRMVEDFHPLLFHSWTEEQVIDVVGPGGVAIWVHFRPEMLKRGQYEVSIDPDTSIPQTRGVREAKAAKVYELLKTNPLINPVELTRYLLHEMHGVAFDSMMQGIPDGAGLSQQNPISVQQYGQLMNNVQTNAPQLLPRATNANV